MDGPVYRRDHLQSRDVLMPFYLSTTDVRTDQIIAMVSALGTEGYALIVESTRLKRSGIYGFALNCN